MASTMTHWERIRAAIKGEETDRVPVSLWRHWPVDDETAAGLANAMVKWQRTYDFDLVKFMPTGTYGVHDWGAQTEYNPGFRGNRLVTQPGLTSYEQWPELPILDNGKGDLGREVEAIGLATAELDNSVPILQTVFSPLTTAVKLAGERVYADMRLHPEELKAGLQIITDVTIQFSLACIRAGAHGVFFASQNGSYRLSNQDEFKKFGMHYDVEVLNGIRGESEFNMFHVHGEDIMFDLAADYPIEMINWHDRVTSPSLGEAQERFSGLLVGGINDRSIDEQTADQVYADVTDAIEQTGGRRLLVAPGCVIATNTPDENVRAAIKAVEDAA